MLPAILKNDNSNQMTDIKTGKLALIWRQDLLKLKDSVKQKLFNTDRALAIAQKIKRDYTAHSVKPDADIQNAHIQLCDTLDNAKKILSEYRSDSIPYTTATFNILISLSGDLPTATAYFNSLLDQGLKPNIYTLNGFIPYCRSVDQGREIIKLMDRHFVKPNTQTFNALLSLTNDAIAHQTILNEMKVQSIEINLVTFNTLISRSLDYETAIKFYHDLKARHIKPTINTFVTLLKKANRHQEIIELENLLKKENISPNNSWDRLRQTIQYGR